MDEHIEVTLFAVVEHVRGVEVDPDHARAWIVADGLFLHGRYNGFEYGLCPDHADPEECGESCSTGESLYRVTLHGADWPNRPPVRATATVARPALPAAPLAISA